MSLIRPIIRVPHLRDGPIVAKVGIARQRDRFPTDLNSAQVLPSTLPYPVILSEAQRSRRTPTVSTSPTPSRAFCHNRALASRYPKASALGLITAQEEVSFSPWGMPSHAAASIPEVPA
jgi:hypothetical protein